MAEMFKAINGFKYLCQMAGIEPPFVFAVTGKQKDELFAEIEGLPKENRDVDYSVPEGVDVTAAERTPGLLGFVNGVVLVQNPFM
jgi:hypothetical protein